MLVDISVIILTKNGGANFPRLLERIYSQQYSGSFEAIVIDSGSTDGTLAVAGKYPLKIVQIKPHEFHHSRTRNLGAELAQGKYLVYITQDALPLDDKWLQNLTADFNDPQVAMVVGRQIPWESTKPPEKFFYYYNFPDFKIVVKSGADDYYHDNVFISDVNSAYRKDILLKYRFKEDIVMAEDKETAARMLAGGWTITYEPAATVYHAHDYTIRQLFNRALDYGLALRQGAAALPASKMTRLRRLLVLIRYEIKFLQIYGGWRWLPYIFAYNSSMYLGLFLGKAGIAEGPMARRLKQTHE